MNNYLMLNNQKIDLTDEQVEKIKLSYGFEKSKLSDFSEGETFKLGEYEFIVLEHGKETTAVILKDLLEKNMSFGENNNFADENCRVRKRLEEFADKLETLIGTKTFVEHTVDLTSDDGLKDYGKIKAKVSLLTCERYRRYVDILDNHKPDSWWWLATADSTPKHSNSNYVKCVSPSGRMFCDNYYYDYGGVRPFCILKSNIFVSK